MPALQYNRSLAYFISIILFDGYEFSKACSIKFLDKPDRTLDVNSYEISVIHSSFWDDIKSYNYNIDSCNDISHMYFFHDEFYVASLEIVDYKNYVLFEETFNQQNTFLDKEMELENAVLCFKGKEDISDLLEEWKPLGKGCY
ncbi:MAG: hypothetical protein J6A77_03385 [Lachnospiraceae bacterium]|nr:hypothetical protein [Lachnospiraceae bacterium]